MKEIGYEMARRIHRIRVLVWRACRVMRVVDAVGLVYTVARLFDGAGGWWWVALVWFPIAFVGDSIGVRRLKPPPRRRRPAGRRAPAVRQRSGRRRTPP